MSQIDFQSYVVPGALVLYFVWRFFKLSKAKQQVPTLLEKGGVIVDVRSPSEFKNGSRSGSINIPLDQLDRRASELNPEVPVILCCASGARSGRAASMLKRKGFKSVTNIGSWSS